MKKFKQKVIIGLALFLSVIILFISIPLVLIRTIWKVSESMTTDFNDWLDTQAQTLTDQLDELAKKEDK